jgi:glucose-1-phosphate thymidylyltransferase
MKAVILAAGKGKRMRHLSAYLPKSLLMVKDKPLLGWILDGLSAAGVTEFCIVTGYLGDSIEKYFGDGHSRNIHLQYRRQPGAEGTGRALELARGFVGDEPFLLTLGDVFTAPEHYASMRGRFLDAPTGVIGVRKRDRDSDAAAAILDEQSNLYSLIDRASPRAERAEWQDAGLYALPPETFQFTTHLHKSGRGEQELSEVLTAMVQAGYRVRAHELPGYWLDVSNPEDLKRAEQCVA